MYANNAVPHILSGKAVARAIRGHLLVDAALNALLVSHTFHLPLSDTLDEVDTVEDQQEATEAPRPSINEDLEQAKVLYNRLVENSDARSEVCSSEALNRIAKSLRKKAMQSMVNNRTVMLWIKYMEMVDKLRLSIKAERTGSWMLHLKAVQKMLP